MRQVPSTDIRPAKLRRVCPRCGAQIGAKCTKQVGGPDGYTVPMKNYHSER